MKEGKGRVPCSFHSGRDLKVLVVDGEALVMGGEGLVDTGAIGLAS